MKNRFDSAQAARFDDVLSLRAYTSRLLGGDPALTLHGGGNTSVKVCEHGEEWLYIKGSGTDLAHITESGFSAVRMSAVTPLIERETLDNAGLMAAFRAALKDPAAPQPSIETLLHAVLPYPWVEHTHADAILAIADTPHGEAHLRAALGDDVLVVPYRHSGFDLAKCCHDVHQRQATPRTLGMVLMHHGIFAFGQDARTSYEAMIELVKRAENYLDRHAAWEIPLPAPAAPETPDPLAFAALRRDLSLAAGAPLLLAQTGDPLGWAYARRPDLDQISQQGPATPHHAVFAKRVPLLGRDVARYAKDYRQYLAAHAPAGAHRLPDPAPRVVLDPQWGLCVAGVSARHCAISAEIAHHAMEIAWRAQALERYISLPPQEVLAAEIEYGGFEEKVRCSRPLAGQVMVVGQAVERRAEIAALLAQGAAIIAIDTHEEVATLFSEPAFLGIACPADDARRTGEAIERGICTFGGIDHLAGCSGPLEETCRPWLALSPVSSALSDSPAC